MNSARVAAGLLVVMFLASQANSQEVPEFGTAEKEHALLQKFVGEWETVSEAVMGPGQPTVKCEGRIRGRMLGDLWVVNQSEGNIMGTTMHALQTIGYDPAKKKYVGTWVDNMMNHMWKYEGTLDEAGKILTLEAEGPNFLTPGKTTKFRDSYEFKSPDHIIARSSMQGEDGKWIEFMTGHVRRAKPAAAE